MCLDQGSFVLRQGDEETALDHVASILPLAGRLRVVDVLGKTREIVGTIEEIDLLNRRITVA